MARVAGAHHGLRRGAHPGGPPKKLIAAARAWCRGAGGSEAAEAARAFGLALEAREDEVEVWPECAESVELFLALATQWRVAPMSGTVLGLDYAAARAAMEMMGIEDRRQAFEDVRVMESEVIRILRERDRGR